MLYHKMNIAGIDWDLPLCPVTDDLYIAGFVILGAPALTEACARDLLKKSPEYDYILTAECKGIPLAHEMARQHGDESYIIARKATKLYMVKPLSVSVRSITTDAQQTLYLDWHDAEKIRGKRVLIVDDVISTGESIRALEELVKEAEGIIVGKATILAEGAAAKRDDIIFLNELPVFNADGSIKE